MSRALFQWSGGDANRYFFYLALYRISLSDKRLSSFFISFILFHSFYSFVLFPLTIYVLICRIWAGRAFFFADLFGRNFLFSFRRFWMELFLQMGGGGCTLPAYAPGQHTVTTCNKHRQHTVTTCTKHRQHTVTTYTDTDNSDNQRNKNGNTCNPVKPFHCKLSTRKRTLVVGL